MKAEEKRYQEFLDKYAANSERLSRIGIYSFGYDPGYIARIDDCNISVDLPTILVEKICDLIKQVYPETADDKKMLEEYEIRQKEQVELYNICDKVHSSCNDSCLVYKLNDHKVLNPDNKSFGENRGCDCFKSGRKMRMFIKERKGK